MNLDFSKCKCSEDVKEVFLENKEQLLQIEQIHNYLRELKILSSRSTTLDVDEVRPCYVLGLREKTSLP